MGTIKSKQLLEGRFIGFGEKEETKPKYLQLATKEGEKSIKLPKKLQNSVSGLLTPGDWLQVGVKQTINPKKGEVKLKAKYLLPSTPGKAVGVFKPTEKPNKKTKDCVMVCQKSSCCKRGAADVSRAISKALEEKGLAGEIAIKGTGCMNQCKKGPCVVFMPDKSRYIQVKSKQIPELVEKHFANKLESAKVSR